MDRIYLFLPSIIIIASIAIFSYIYLFLTVKRFGDKVNSIQWIKDNEKKVVWRIVSPQQYVFAPTSEELFFRAPLIIMFSSLSEPAWYGIVISGILFGFLHIFGQKLFLEDITDETKTDDAKAEMKRLCQEKQKMIIRRKIYHALFASLLGICFGYIGIVYQSLWASVCAHALWNMFGPILLIIMAIIAQIIIHACSPFWNWITR